MSDRQARTEKVGGEVLVWSTESVAMNREALGPVRSIDSERGSASEGREPR